MSNSTPGREIFYSGYEKNTSPYSTLGEVALTIPEDCIVELTSHSVPFRGLEEPEIKAPCIKTPHFETATTSPNNQGPYCPVAYPVPREKTAALHESIWRHASELAVPEYMSLAAGKARPPKSLADYRFVPVPPEDPDYLEHNLSSVGSRLITAPDVHFEYDYGGIDNAPFLDGRICLGLAFRGRLVAICSGGLAEEGPIIVQLQDVSTKKPPVTDDPKILRSFPYSNGLHSGLDWKTTLARGWCSLASRVLPEVLPGLEGAPVWVQSAINSHWANRRQYAADGSITGRYAINQERLKRFSVTYNGTARKLGAVPDPQTKNFILAGTFSVGAYATA